MFDANVSVLSLYRMLFRIRRRMLNDDDDE
jgi:hypothetical protein